MVHDYWNNIDWYGMLRGAVVEHKTRQKCIRGVAELNGEFRYLTGDSRPEPGERTAMFKRCPICGAEFQ